MYQFIEFDLSIISWWLAPCQPPVWPEKKPDSNQLGRPVSPPIPLPPTFPFDLTPALAPCAHAHTHTLADRQLLPINHTLRLQLRNEKLVARFSSPWFLFRGAVAKLSRLSLLSHLMVVEIVSSSRLTALPLENGSRAVFPFWESLSCFGIDVEDSAFPGIWAYYLS